MADTGARERRRTARPAEPPLWRTPAVGALAAITLLVATTVVVAIWLSVLDERRERQQALTRQAEHVAMQISGRLAETEQVLLLEGWAYPSSPERFAIDMAGLVRTHPTLVRVELRGPDGDIVASVDAPPPRIAPPPSTRNPPPVEVREAIAAAGRQNRPAYAAPHHLQVGDAGIMLIELVVPSGDGSGATLVAVHSARRLLEQVAAAEPGTGLQFSLVEDDGTTVARHAPAGMRAASLSASVPLGPNAPALRAKVEADPEPARLIPSVLTALVVVTTLALGLAMARLVADVRRRARVELALREQVAFRRSIEDAMPLAMVVYDLQNHCVHVNEALCRRTGFSPADLVGRRAPLPFSTPDSRREYAAYRARIARAREDGDEPEAVATRGFESEYRAKDGELFPVHVIERKVQNGDGSVVGYMMLGTDLTERRRLEELARRQQEALQSHARLATLGEMASTLSHELNQPLAAITSYATACENLIEARPARPDPVRQALRGIRAQAERAGQVIHSVQSFLRRRAVERVEVDLSTLMRGLEPLLRLQAVRTGARVDIDVPPGTGVFADRIMLEQVLLNLTRNGFEAMADVPDAERVLSVTARRVDGDERGPRVEVSVADRGHGVPAEVLPQLFSAFFTTKREGMGLGLSLCRSVIEKHGGSLVHHDRAGGGSVFSFDLPPAGPAGQPAGHDGAAT